ncbi:ring finger domain containing protein [Stagonosporopsis vannaccii]|nr:ring finger domain containing protein [Stagonosporopsis vannaccii]
MSATGRRGVARKSKKQSPFLFGSSFVHLLVGPHNRKFSAHEDVLCFHSIYFKNHFQKVRKEISGECAICFEDLEIAETVYCRTCGQNFHTKCMERWLRTESNACPTCRTAWKKPTSGSSTHALDQLDPEGFEVYVQWLYSRRVPSYAVGTTDDCCVRMLKAHLVGSALTDGAFLLAVRNRIVEVAVEGGLGYAVVDFAYKNTHEPCALRRFLVDLYALTGSMDSLKDGNISHLFLIDMAQSFMDKSRQPAEGETVWTRLAAEGHIEVEDENEQP